MRNLKSIVDSVYDQLDYNPDLAAYRDSVVRRVNEAYLDICDGAEWLFLQKVDDFPLYAKVDGADDKTVSATASFNRRLVTGVGTSFESHYEGQTITINGADYVIAHVASKTSLYIVGLPDGDIAATGDWYVTFNRYRLPADCIEVLGWMDRSSTNTGRLTFVDRRAEERLNMKATNKGTSQVVIQDDFDRIDPPFTAPSLSTPSGGSLTANVEYEYAYAYSYKGMESPLSLTAKATPHGSHRTVTVQMEDTRWQDPDNGVANANAGISKVVYRRDVTNNGRWARIAKVAPTATSYDDTDPIADSKGSLHLNGHLADDGVREMIRVWYTPGADRTVEIRYKVRPRRLIGDADAPVLPLQYRPMLKFAVMRDLLEQVGEAQRALVWERRYQEMLRRMRRRYLTRTDRTLRRRYMDTFRLREGRFTRFADPRKI